MSQIETIIFIRATTFIYIIFLIFVRGLWQICQTCIYLIYFFISSNIEKYTPRTEHQTDIRLTLKEVGVKNKGGHICKCCISNSWSSSYYLEFEKEKSKQLLFISNSHQNSLIINAYFSVKSNNVNSCFTISYLMFPYYMMSNE